MTENSRRLELEKLQIQVSREIDDLESAFDNPLTILGNGDAWTGTKADEFGDEVEGHRIDLKAAVGLLLDDIAAAVEAEPEASPGEGE